MGKNMELTSGLTSTPNSLVAAAIETQKKNVGLSPSPRNEEGRSNFCQDLSSHPLHNLIVA